MVGSVDLPQQYKITRKDATQETFLVVQGEVIEDLVPINLLVVTLQTMLMIILLMDQNLW